MNVNRAFPTYRLFCVVMMLAVLFLSLMLSTAPALAADPDFTTDDPLEGNWELSRVTDLMMYQTHGFDSNTKSNIHNYFLDTEDEKITSQSNRILLTSPCWLSEQRQPQVTRAGRFFAMGNDVAITMATSVNAGNPNCSSTNGDANMGLYIVDPKTNAAPLWVHFSASAKESAMAMADFNQDGFEDLFILNETEAFAATATDIHDLSGGMTFGVRTHLGSTALAPKWDPVTADFNDDGLIDVAWIGQNSTLYFATVCPGSVTGTVCSGKAALDVILNPLNSRKNVHTPPNADCWYTSDEGDGRSQALAAGNFFTESSGSTEKFGRLVALGCATPESGKKMRAYSYKFDSTMTVTQQQFIDIATCQDACGSVYAEGARLQWNATSEQVVFTYSNVESVQDQLYPRQQYLVGVVHFQGANMSAPFNIYKSINPWTDPPEAGNLGLATGHFSSIPDSNTSPEAYNLQIAVALNLSPPEVYIFTVNVPHSYSPSLAAHTTLESSLGIPVQNTAFNKLLAADLQGRADRLGPPTKIKVESHLQPSVVLASPPMHADYVLPNQQTASEASILNITAAPAGFYTAYTQGGSAKSESSRTDTTSYTYSYAESTSEKFSFNVPLISGVSGSFQQSWKQQYNKTSTNYSYSKVENDYSLAQGSGLNDTVWYQSNDFYVYFYPVLGQTVCPEDMPNCDASQMQPLYISFSGPVNSTISPLDGGTTEWYQPVHEEGQLFSYVWDISQLKARFPESGVMSTNEVILTTDPAAPFQSKVEWISDTSDKTSTQNTYTHSFATDNSITAGGIDKDEGGAEFSGSFDYSNSKAVSTLNTSSTDLGAYTQIDLYRPAFQGVGSDSYKYSFQPLVINQGAPTGTVQVIDAAPTVYATTGTIATEYVMKPPTDATQGWGDRWKSADTWYTQNIDVALNHPDRWFDGMKVCEATEQYSGQCLQPYLPQLKTFGAANDEPYMSQWHHMRGLLVTVGAPGGPQRISAQVGDAIYLQARVYNYSLKAMDSNDQIKVQFYRQGYEDSALIGDATLIEESTVGPLAAYGNSALTPNWTTATANFTATEEISGTYQVFWVVTWAEDAGGNMVQEVNGHGLNSKPGTLTSIVQVPIQAGPVVPTTTGSGTTSFTNNVGLYHQPFCIGVCGNSLAASPESPTLTIRNLVAAISEHQRFTQYLIEAELHAENGTAEAVQISLIEEHGGQRTILDTDILPIVAEGHQVVRIPYAPRECGDQTLLLEVRSSNAGSSVQPLKVEAQCPPIYLPVVAEGSHE